LKIVHAGEKDHYERLIEILFNGYAAMYFEIEGNLSDDMPDDEGQFVLDILSLYRHIEGFKFHHASNKIKEHPYGNFTGFDLNYEGNYYSFAKFLIDENRSFTEQWQYRQKTDGFNTHWPILDKYTIMLARWDELGRKHDLSEADILGIINC
jgi:hypothetical protein